MSMDIIESMRALLLEYRQSIEYKKGESLSVFSANVIEISIALTELAVKRDRKITKEEKYWFEASYHLNFEFVGGPWEELYRLYLKLVEQVEREKYFEKGT